MADKSSPLLEMASIRPLLCRSATLPVMSSEMFRQPHFSVAHRAQRVRETWLSYRSNRFCDIKTDYIMMSLSVLIQKKMFTVKITGIVRHTIKFNTSAISFNYLKVPSKISANCCFDLMWKLAYISYQFNIII